MSNAVKASECMQSFSIHVGTAEEHWEYESLGCKRVPACRCRCRWTLARVDGRGSLFGAFEPGSRNKLTRHATGGRGGGGGRNFEDSTTTRRFNSDGSVGRRWSLLPPGHGLLGRRPPGRTASEQVPLPHCPYSLIRLVSHQSPGALFWRQDVEPGGRCAPWLTSGSSSIDLESLE